MENLNTTEAQKFIQTLRALWNTQRTIELEGDLQFNGAELGHHMVNTLIGNNKPEDQDTINWYNSLDEDSMLEVKHLAFNPEEEYTATKEV